MSQRVCNSCPDPKPQKTDADFYPKHPTRCIDCSKKYQAEYRAKVKLNKPPKSEKTLSETRHCKGCDSDKTAAEFHSPGNQCSACINRLRKERRDIIKTAANQVPFLKDQRIKDLEEQIRLRDLLDEARQTPTGNSQQDSASTPEL